MDGLNNFPMVTQVVNGRAGIQSQGPRPCPLFYTSHRNKGNDVFPSFHLITQTKKTQKKLVQPWPVWLSLLEDHPVH